MECPRLKWIEKEHALMAEIDKEGEQAETLYRC